MIDETLAPIVLFVYNRPDHTRETLEALEKNTLSKKSRIFIYADGPKESCSEDCKLKIEETRSLCKSRSWCGEVTFLPNSRNKGLANSIISGVTEIISKYGKIIVLEDDIVTGKYFLEYMNFALNRYKADSKVWSITGWRFPVYSEESTATYFYPHMDCWSWATWDDRWRFYKKDPAYYINTFNKKQIYAFNMNGAWPDCWRQIEKNASNEINTWAVFWGATIFENKGLCLGPCKSLVKNVGFDNSGMNCSQNEYYIIHDDINQKIELFPNEVEINVNEYKKNMKYLKRVYKSMVPFSFSFLIPKEIKSFVKKALR